MHVRLRGARGARRAAARSSSRRGSSRRFLRGRDFSEAPDITARICGICPVAYQMSACRAIEDALGVEVERPGRASCGGSSTAASGSRATPCTSTCSTRPTSSATRAPSRWPRDHGEIVERGLRTEEGRQRADRRDRRPRGAPDQRPRRRLLPGAASGASWRRCGSRSSGPASEALETVRWVAALPVPRPRARLRVRRAPRRRRPLPDRAAAGSSPRRGHRHRGVPRSTTSSRSATSSTPTRSTR